MDLNVCYSWLCWAGLLYLIRFAILTIYEIIFAIKVHIIPKIFPTTDLTKYGEWAVILGAEDEIIACYAEELASKNLKILLVSKSLNKISETAKRIERAHKVQVKCLTVDFRNEKAIYDIFAKQIEGLDIGVLVCGVDNRRQHVGPFLDASPDELWGTIDNNMTSIAMVMSLVLPGMLKRRRGKIVNLSSLAALDPQPNTTAQESATKAFSLFLSRACQVELGPQGVEVQTLTPATILNDPAHPFLFDYPTARAYARSAVSVIDRCNMTTGHWVHGILQFLKYNLPTVLWKIIEDAGSQKSKAKIN